MADSVISTDESSSFVRSFKAAISDRPPLPEDRGVSVCLLDAVGSFGGVFVRSGGGAVSKAASGLAIGGSWAAVSGSAGS